MNKGFEEFIKTLIHCVYEENLTCPLWLYLFKKRLPLKTKIRGLFSYNPLNNPCSFNTRVLVSFYLFYLINIGLCQEFNQKIIQFISIDFTIHIFGYMRLCNYLFFLLVFWFLVVSAETDCNWECLNISNSPNIPKPMNPTNEK